MNRLRNGRRSVAAIALVLLAAGAILIAAPLAHAVQARVSAAQAKEDWKKWKQTHSGRRAKVAPEPGEPVCWLRVPSCKISTLVMRESDAEALHRYPAVRRLESGGSVMFAHRDVHFRGLANVRVGDEFTVESADGRVAKYTVCTLRVLLPEQVSGVVDQPDNRDAVHLLTCYPFHYIGAAPKRFLVTAARSVRSASAQL